MRASVDTNILLDLLTKSPKNWEKSSKLLKEHSENGSLLICPIVYSELLVFFLRKMQPEKAQNELDLFLKDFDIQIVEFDMQDFVISSKSWTNFLNIKEVICPQCGEKCNFKCAKCKSAVLWRNHLITDFLIGAHAQNHSDILLTRDRGYYKRYFKLKSTC